LAIIVIGRRDTHYSPQLLLPTLGAAVAWSAWAWREASLEAWAAALVLPFTQTPDWLLPLKALGLGVPFAPLAAAGLSRRVREAWPTPTRTVLSGWLQAAMACLVAGTIVPGLAQAAQVPALAGLLMGAAAVLESAWSRSLALTDKRLFMAVLFGLLAAWLIVLLYGSYVWLLIFPYYRSVGIAALVLSIPTFGFGWLALQQRNARRGLAALVCLSLVCKLVHWGYFVPEWNYRHGQGPWGRAIGQWLLPHWTVHTFHDWPSDLAFAIGRPVFQLRSPQHLAFPASSFSKHVLLLESEFTHWPPDAPSLILVARFQDQRGGSRVLARTKGILTTPSGTLYSNDGDPQSD
jgi:hypothetical protein